MCAQEQILAVGDIHGRLDLLERLLAETWPRRAPQARLVFLGDYIDRGPSSKEVVERLTTLKAQRPETVLLRGNHEDMLLAALEGRLSTTWLVNGGEATLRSYGLAPMDLDKLPAAHLEFFRGLELMHRALGYVFVHAGLRPGIAIDQQDPHDLVWIRDEFYMSDYDFGEKVVFGHTPFPRPLVREHLIGVDTGAVYGNALTCLLLPGEKLITV